MSQPLLPKSDDVLERHQYYSAISSEVGSLKEEDIRQHASMSRVHTRLDGAVTALTNLRESISTTETRNRTLAASVVVAWSLISGIFGWAWDKSSSKIETFIVKVEKQEKDTEELKRLTSDIKAIENIKRQVAQMQRDIDDHIAIAGSTKSSATPTK